MSAATPPARGASPLRVLVTGAGGFVGGAVARQLAARGDIVRTVQRGRYPELARAGFEVVTGDVADPAVATAAVEGMDAVIHVAGKAGAWGPYAEFHRSNVAATEQLVEACVALGVRTLVYTSTPSVVFNGSDMEGADEQLPYPARYEAHYPATKAIAERLVLAADGRELRGGGKLATVALRPHLVWGPGDTNLGPRIVARARAGALRVITGPPKKVDVTYIDDAARAHVLALDVLHGGGERAEAARGRAYFIHSATIETWAMVQGIVRAAGLPPIARSISPRAAHIAGAVLELVHTLLRRRDEPRMTRWVARELSTAHWFDISAARERLGYAPSVTVDDGLERLAAWWRAQAETQR
jgi:nucleoside-diphosphate-sugar epimerase